MTKTLIAFANSARKALIAAASVAASIEAFSGTPDNVHTVAAAVVAILAAFGITYQVSNKPKV